MSFASVSDRINPVVSTEEPAFNEILVVVRILRIVRFRYAKYKNVSSLQFAKSSMSLNCKQSLVFSHSQWRARAIWVAKPQGTRAPVREKNGLAPSFLAASSLKSRALSTDCEKNDGLLAIYNELERDLNYRDELPFLSPPVVYENTGNTGILLAKGLLSLVIYLFYCNLFEFFFNLCYCSFYFTFTQLLQAWRLNFHRVWMKDVCKSGMCCSLKWISGQNDFKLVWFDFPFFQIYYDNPETKKNQIKLVWNHFDLKFI